MEFQFGGRSGIFFSTAKILIVNDLISEPTESFICVILRPRGVDGIIVEYPNTYCYCRR